MVEFRKVQKVGDSLMVSIPARMAERLRIEAGDSLRIDLVQDKLVVSTVRPEELFNIEYRSQKEVCEA
ncbi:MAG: AbrB/MazE/SpoVT family DNA-binding domain-containing protein [Candidatus Odinarchaeia archaeon]